MPPVCGSRYAPVPAERTSTATAPSRPAATAPPPRNACTRPYSSNVRPRCIGRGLKSTIFPRAPSPSAFS